MVAFRGKRVVVSGGAGFVGSTLVRELLSDGAKVTVYDNFLHGHRQNLDEIADQITIVPGDVLDEWKFLDAITDSHAEYLFHCVGDTYVPTAYDVPKRFFRINVEGTLNALQLTKRAGLKRMLYVSSTEVYGEALEPKIDEKHPLDPLNTYAVSKLAADRLCYTAHLEHEIPVVTARIFNAYGPRETEPYVVPEIIAQADRSDTIYLGNLKARRDFTYVQDTARGLMAVMASKVPNGVAVNVGSERAYSVQELAERILRIMGKQSARIKVDQRRLRRKDIQLFNCDASYLRKMTGWTPKISLDDGLRRTVDWFVAHGRRWSWEDFVNGTLMYR